MRMQPQTLTKQLQNVVYDALRKYYPGLESVSSALESEYTITSSRNFGDIQLKGLIRSARMQELSPAEVAERVSAEISKADFVAKAVPEKVGYVNVFIKPSWICSELLKLLDYGARMKTLVEQRNKRVIIDYSSPNLSKELHAGHLRSTVIGDCLTRILEFTGCTVNRINFVGDWGTQFGMIIRFMIDHPEVPCEKLSDMDKLYVLAKKKFDSDPEFADASRSIVVSNQSGEFKIREIWRRIIDISIEHIQSIYEIMGIKLQRSDIKGESTMNDALVPLIDELVEKKIVFKDAGSMIALTPSLSKYFNGPPVCILRKKDGGYNYSATDCASLIYRLVDLQSDLALYVVDSRQKVHLAQVFDIVGRAGYIKPHVEVLHLEFGMILGKDQKPFKSRTGDNIKLTTIIEEVSEKACSIAREKNNLRSDENKLTEEQVNKIGKSIAIGAIKYADLSKNRVRDYVLNLDSIVSFEGDTAPYIMYAFTRSFSVARNAGVKDLNPETIKKLNMTPVDTITPQEHALAMAIIQFPEVISQASLTYLPHILCAHVFRVANLFAKFYETSTIIKCDDENSEFRIILTVLTAKTLELGLDLLGIETLEVM